MSYRIVPPKPRHPYEVRDPYRRLAPSIEGKIEVLLLSILTGVGTSWIIHELGHLISAAFLGEHLIWTSPVNCHFYPTNELNRFLIAIGGNMANLITGISFILPALVAGIKDERLKIFLAGFGGFNLILFLVDALMGYWH
jgi:hypothetical protein